jgi:RNA polymerase sigma-70 factor (ECF subfamily)
MDTLIHNASSTIFERQPTKDAVSNVIDAVLMPRQKIEKKPTDLRFDRHSSDADLVAGCLKSDQLAQRYLYERYFGKMMGIALRYANDQEEGLDIVNTAFLKVFQSLDRYQDQQNLAGWIARIVFNSAIDMVRKKAKYKNQVELETWHEPPVSNDAVSSLQSEDLFRLIAKLPVSTRTVFSLYVLDGYKHQEIADMLDISEGTSKWHLSEARKLLRQMIDKQGKTLVART